VSIGQLVAQESTSRFNRRQREEDKLKGKFVIKKRFLRDQILIHGRIDLLMTEILDYLVEDFHLLMWYHRANNYLKIDTQKAHLSLAPRGTGKSTILTISSSILDVLKDPNERILIASKTDANAVGFLSEIKKKLESKKLVEIFGRQKGDVWNDGEINVFGRTSSAKEKTITTIGVGSALASRHFNKIYGDDLVDEENSLTEGQRRKIVTWHDKVLDPCLEPDGEISYLGTLYHYDDLWNHLIKRQFEKRNKRGKVVKKFYIRIPALIRKKNIKPGIKMSKRYISIWPDKFSVKFLLKKRKDWGTIIFNSQMQNDISLMKGEIFQYDWFIWYRPEDIKRKNLIVFQGVDLAISKKSTADKFAHVTIGIHKKTLQIYVLDYFFGILHYIKQKDLIKKKFFQWDPVKVGIEVNGYQGALLDDMRGGLDLDLKKVRAVPVFTDSDKIMRAWKLSAYFERSQIELAEGMHGMQEHLLKMGPNARYKDLFDALDIAVHLGFGRKRNSREEEPGLI